MLAAALPLLVVALDSDVSVKREAQLSDHSEEDARPIVGGQVDVGVPDGLGVTAMVMPSAWLRIQATALTNGVGFGGRAGFTLLPLPDTFKTFRPLLGLEAGYVSGGDASWLPVASDLQRLVSGVSYVFGNAHVGFEVGSATFALVVRGGISYLDAALEKASVGVATTTVTASGVAVRGVIPSARIGIMFAFL